MFNIDSPSAVTVQPTPTTAGVAGWFAHGNPGTGTPYTVVTSDFLNIIQAELINIITAAGGSPSKTSQNQVLNSLSNLHGMQAFTTGGTFTPPSYVTKVKVICTGGGGGGAGGISSETGGGGGAGGTAIGFYFVTPGVGVSVTVGAGGAGGAAGQTNGSAGGTSSFGSSCSATGGGGGVNTGLSFAGGNGGIGSSGTINMSGGTGGAGSLAVVFSSQGGAGFWGGGSEASTVVNNYTMAYGAGGGSGVYSGSNVAGSTGMGGIVMVEW